MAQAAEPQQYPPFMGNPQYVMVPVAQRNGLGVFGFFTALIGLFIPTGIIALLGLLICLVALGRSPRGFAMMGLIVGLFGTVLWLLIDLAVILVGLVAVIGIGLGTSAAFIMTQPEVVEITSDMVSTAIAVEHHHETTGEMPLSLDGLELSPVAMTDPWGTRYRYELRDPEQINDNNPHELRFELISAGPDTEFDTDDDIAFSRLDQLWANAFDTFEEKMEAFGEKWESVNRSGGFQYRCSDGSGGYMTFGGSCAEAPVEPDQTVAPEASRAATGSYAESYQRKAEQAIKAEEPADTPDTPTEPPAPDRKPAGSGSGPV